VELTIVGTAATVAMNGKVVASGVDVSSPLTAPGATKSYLPLSGFAGLGGGPDYSIDLAFDNFTVSVAAGEATHSASICRDAAPKAGMAVVGVPCGLDVPGLAFDIIQAPGAMSSHDGAGAGGGQSRQRVVPRLDHSLCVTQSLTLPQGRRSESNNDDGGGDAANRSTRSGIGSDPANATSLVLRPCNTTADPLQDVVYDRQRAVLRPADASPPVDPSPWQGFTPGEGIAYGKPFAAGDTIAAVRNVTVSHAAPFDKQETLEFFVNGVSQGARAGSQPTCPQCVCVCVGRGGGGCFQVSRKLCF
jgi:hypothetical protein